MLRCYVFFILQCGMEDTTLTEVMLIRIVASGRWLYYGIKACKPQYLGHVMRVERYSIRRLILKNN